MSRRKEGLCLGSTAQQLSASERYEAGTSSGHSSLCSSFWLCPPVLLLLSLVRLLLLVLSGSDALLPFEVEENGLAGRPLGTSFQ